MQILGEVRLSKGCKSPKGKIHIKNKKRPAGLMS